MPRLLKSVLLTGATGLLGRYLLRNLVLLEREVVVLARGSNDGVSARERVDDALRQFEEQLQRTLPRPLVVEGALHEPRLGLSSSDRTWLGQHCSTVLHCAASIQFERDRADEPYRSNVVGTQQLVEFCSGAGISEFHHVSTAYVCGGRQERVFEDDINEVAAFRNDYERSKYSAEQLLRATNCLRSLTVYRPSIIVGDSTSGYSSTFHGFYLPLQLVHLATSAGVLEDRRDYMAALGLRGDERKNLVPVDWVADVLVHIFQHPQLHGRTYHLTNPWPVTTADVDAVIAESLHEKVAARENARPRASIQGATLDDFREQMKVYAAYLGNDPDFDCQNTLAAVPSLPCPRLNHETLVRLARFAIDARFGWPRRRPRPTVLDVDRLLRKLPSVEGRQPGTVTLQLEVSGSFGGVWEIQFDQFELTGVRAGRYGPCDVSGYLNVFTLRDVLQGNQTIAGALASAQLVLEGAPDKISDGPRMFESLCQTLRQSECNDGGGILNLDLPN